MSTLDLLITQRKKQKVKQIEIARHLGITKTTMSKYESKDRKISAEHQDQYAEYLGFEIRIQLK